MDEIVALQAQVAQVAALMARIATVQPHDRRPLSLAQAAARLGVSRSGTLAPAIEKGKVATVPWGKTRLRIPLDEIERLESEGFGGKTQRKSRALPKSRIR